jgi:hypothetical protein
MSAFLDTVTTSEKFVSMMAFAPCNALYCAPGNLCWPCRARQFLKAQAGRQAEVKISGLDGTIALGIILDVVAREFDLEPSFVLGKRRDEKFVIPRHIIFWMMRELTEVPSTEIGEMVGRDHGTVLHGKRNVDERMSIDQKYKARVERLKAVCTEQIKDEEKE